MHSLLKKQCNGGVKCRTFFSPGMFVFSVLEMLPPTHRYLAHASRAFTSGFGNKGVLSSAAGGAILGVGMTLGGSVC